MGKAGKNRDDYRLVNRGLVLKTVATGQNVTRMDLVRSTGLSKMAISNIVSELIGRDLLVETGTAPSDEPGRRPVCLDISPKAPKVAGLAIRREGCEAVLCDLKLQILRRERSPLEDRTAQGAIDLAFRLLDAVAGDAIDIGIASIGPVSVQEGKILKPFYFHGICDVPIVEAVERRYGLPVFFGHDDQSSVLAERLFGSVRDCQDLLFLGAGGGVGCGILSGGQPLRDRRGLSSELGHVSIDIHGPACPCGSRGCLESYIRTPVLLEKFRERTGKDMTYREFCQMEDDPAVEGVLMEAVDKLASALTSTVNILNSEEILLGGDCVDWPDRYLKALEEAVDRRRFVDWGQRVRVRRTSFLRSAVVMGAACNAVVPIFQGDLVF